MPVFSEPGIFVVIESWGAGREGELWGRVCRRLCVKRVDWIRGSRLNEHYAAARATSPLFYFAYVPWGK